MQVYKRKHFLVATSVVLWLAAGSIYAQCTKDTECKGERICERGTCIAPSPTSIKPAESPNLSSQVTTSAERISAALQNQLKCESPPEPGKMLRALKSLGYIGAKPQEAVDGMTVWKFEKPVTVFGYKAVRVTGWEDKPDGVFFWRGPGTTPGLHLTVVVEGEAKTVEANLKQSASAKLSVERDSLVPGGKPAAAITCYSR